MGRRAKGIHRSRPGTRTAVVKRWCKRCEEETYFSRRVRPDGRLQHDCKQCKQRRDKARHTPTRNSWRGMVTRCNNPNAWNYRYYGGRGISVCERWLDFEAFAKDMGERPEGLTLDRMDPEGNYACGKCSECVAGGVSPGGNCRWATWSEQQENKRRPDENASQFLHNWQHNVNESREKGLRERNPA